MGIEVLDGKGKKADDYEKMVDDMWQRLHKAGFTGVDAIMGHVEQSLKHWGIDWKLREGFK